MNAPQPDNSQPVKEISIARLATAIFSALAFMLSFGALIVAADNDGDGGGKTSTQGGTVQKVSAVLEGSAIPATATPVTLKEFSFDPKMVMVDAGGVLKVTNKGAAPHVLAVEGTDLATPELQPSATA